MGKWWTLPLQQVGDEARQRRSRSCSQNNFAEAQQLGRRSKVRGQVCCRACSCVLPGGLAVVPGKRGCYVLDFPTGDVTSMELQCGDAGLGPTKIAPLLCSSEPPPGALRSALGPPASEGHGTMGASPGEAMKMNKGLELLCCEDRLRELGLFTLGKRRLQRHFTVTFQCQQGPTGKLVRDSLPGV